MAKANKIFSCTCCGSDVTVPYFAVVNGEKGVYGYTCIKKVLPNTKKQASKKWFAAEVEVQEKDGKAIVKVNYNGVVVKLKAAYNVFAGEYEAASFAKDVNVVHQAVSADFLKEKAFRFRAGSLQSILDEIENRN